MLTPSAARTRYVGFGLDYQYFDKYPDKLDGLCARYLERLSHLSIVALPDVPSARQFKAIAGGRPIIHHLSDVAPANPEGPDLERLALQDEISLALGAQWAGEDVGIWALGPYHIPYFAPPLFESEVVERVCEEVARVQAGSSVPFLAEIPSCSFVAGRLTLGEFFTRLVERAHCPLVLDISHVYSYGLVSGTPASEVLRSIPLHMVWEIHVAGGSVNKTHPFRYIDSHSVPILEPVLQLLIEAVGLCPRLKAITYEIGMKLPAETIEADLARLEGALAQTGFVPRIGEPRSQLQTNP